MTKKQTKQTSSNNSRGFLGSVIAVIVFIGAVILSQITGIDFVSFLTDSETTVIDATATTSRATSPSATPTTRIVPSVTPTTRAANTAVPTTASAAASSAMTRLTVGQGYGAQRGFWSIYFNAPTGSSDEALYVNGIDVHLAEQINNAQRTLDIVAFEFDNKVLTPAVLAAHERGVTVRIVTDDEHGLEEEDESIPKFIAAGIPVVDDSRGALMHNKFMIIDSQVVWTGSWNYTRNDTYRNNNNALALRSQKAVEVYQTEFNEMFLDKQFGPTSPTGSATFTVDGVEMTVLFASEDPVVENIIAQVNAAESNIRFMAFSFTYDEVGQAMLERAGAGVTVEGVFEKRGSETEYSELPLLYCAGLNVRQDGNPYALHHKVIIIDDHTVLTGSFNFSSNATNSNDENMIIIKDRDIATLYIEEFDRMMAQSKAPDRAKMKCS